MKRKWIIAGVAAGLIVAALIVWSRVGNKDAQGPRGPGAQVLYTCPMHPTYTSDRPGQCPICGMDLVPVKEKEKGPHAGHDTSIEGRAAVTIDMEQQKRIGVKTGGVTKGHAATEIRASARVAFDPDLAVAQKEFIEARRTGDKTLADAGRRRLILMGMGDDQIEGLARRGKVDDNLVLPGKGAWIYAAIYEGEVPHVKVGQEASIEMPDGTSLGTGIVRAVDPVLDPATRTARARIEFKNKEAKLRPNMFLTAIIRNELGERLLVPKSAVIDSGTRKLVFLVHDGEHFIPRDVALGPELADSFVVEKGLDAGDTVATSALFLIDSESQLKAAAGAIGGH